MIISEGRQFIFVHAPKTGGTSLSLALEAKAMKDDILIGDTPKAVRRRKRVKALKTPGRLWKHSTLADLEDIIPSEARSGFKVFTLVRNPWARMVSYYHWLQEQSFDHPAVDLAKSLDFSAFLTHQVTTDAFGNGTYRHYVSWSDGQEQCDLFLRLEHLSEDLAKLESLLGLKIGPVPHVNKSEHPPYRSVYSDQDRDILAALCAEDIARFSYRF